MLDEERRDELLREFYNNRMLAHKVLFAHRHKDETPQMHEEMCALLYDPHRRVAEMAFRGAAKSTWIEEYVCLNALFKDTEFTLIVGPKWESACERLAPIRNELENNEFIIDLFGDQRGASWSADELILANRVKVKAIGVGQSMRGTKHNDERPDEAVIDDLEDEESVRTEDSRRKVERWFNGTLLPALHPTRGRVRFVGTAIHPKSLIVKKCKDPEWLSRVFPIINIDLDTGEEKSAWPSRFPLDWIKKTRQDYINDGNFIEFQQEYMCVSEDVAGKTFQPSMLKIAAAPAVHLPVYTMTDPARTVGEKSARTGYAAFSWLGNQLIVHAAEGHFHKPNEIIAKNREWHDRFKPIHMGVETDGLEEFLMQPFRADMVTNGSMPIIGLKAPRDKISFIKGLQPFYIAGEVIHTSHFPDLESELMQFPTGRIDVPNALAYAARIRAGRPVYEDFTSRHIAAALEPTRRLPKYLVISARAAMTAGALIQYVDGTLKILEGWVYNEPPLDCFERMLTEAVMLAGEVKIAIPEEQFDQYTNYGLPAAIKRRHLVPFRTMAAAKSEGQLGDWLRKQVRGETALLVAAQATWVVNGLAGGYARKLDKSGRLSDQPVDDQYHVIIEAIESWAGWLALQSTGDRDGDWCYAKTDSGKPYITLR